MFREFLRQNDVNEWINDWTTYLNTVGGVNVQVGEDHGQLSSVRMPDLVGTLLVMGIVGVTEGRGGQSSIVAIENSVTT